MSSEFLLLREQPFVRTEHNAQRMEASRRHRSALLLCRGRQPKARAQAKGKGKVKDSRLRQQRNEVTATVVGMPEELNRTLLLFRGIPHGRAQTFSLPTTRHRSTDSSGPLLFSAMMDAAGLIATLKKVRAQSIQPIGERLDACQQFVERARKRLVAAEDVVMKALQIKSRLECELNEGVQRLQRLREEAAAQPRAPIAEHGEVPPIAPEAQAVEVNQLRATIEDLQRERDRLRSEVSHQRPEESRLWNSQ